MKVFMVSTHLTSGSGVSSYTKNLVQSLSQLRVDVIVTLNKPENGSLEGSGEDVCATWTRGSIRYPFQIFKTLAASAGIDIVHFQHEFFLYGGMFSAMLFPVLLVLARLLGKPVVITLHGVIPLSEVNEQFKEENELNGPLPLLRFGLIFLTKTMLFLSDAIIVHGGFFAERLEKDYKCPKRKVNVIPHGVRAVTDNQIGQDEAKEKLGLKDKNVILFFGYITKYKGVETLIDGFGGVAEKYRNSILIIGGGEHPRLCYNPHYAEYLSELHRRAISVAPKGRILFTGFIPEDELPLYLSAADVLVFPYTTSMSSSGPLSFAMHYGKAVIASDLPPFAEIISLEGTLFEQSSPKDLAEKLEQMLDSQVLRSGVSDYVKMRAKEASWQVVGSKTYELYQNLVMHTELLHA